jgi:signal transduction histidine kinase
MIGLWNRSLAARFVFVMLLALALSQGISLLLFASERGEVLLKAAKAEFLSRCASVAKVLESTPTAVHSEILRASDTGYSRFWISAQFPADVAAWEREARRRLAEPLPTVAKIANGDAGPAPEAPAEVAADEAEAPAESAAHWLDLPAFAWPLSRSAKFLYLGGSNGMGLTVQLQDGTWLNTAFAKKVGDGFWTSQSVLSLALTAVILSISAFYVGRAMTRPMRGLAASAEALGRGESVEPLPESGPDDVRQTAEAFNLMQARLQRFVEERTRTLAAIGHDLRTPITSLRLRAEFVADDETREKMLSTIDELRSMTEAALAFSSNEGLRETTRHVDLTALVESLCDDLVELGQDITFVEGDKIDYRCRRDSLKRAVRNLIENAVRYGERARVAIASTAAQVTIVVEDDGPGIPPDKLEQVFSPFFRVETSRNRQTGGIGLGLSIARDVARHHGGDITLANTGHGLRATIVLPRAPADIAPAKAGRSDARGRSVRARWRERFPVV